MVALMLILSLAAPRPVITWHPDETLEVATFPVTISVWDYARVPGDFDFDGDCDGTDFVVWQVGYVSGEYDGADYLTWQNEYGTRWRFSACGVSEYGETVPDWRAGTITYTPGPDYPGADRIVWNVEDDGARLSDGPDRLWAGAVAVERKDGE